MIQNDFNHDDPRRIGHTYWQVGNYKTISKIAALEKANGDINQIKFYWMEDTWDKVNWTQDPSHSWNTLLSMRAWQLRNKYDYLAFCYSGGWDSHTALMSFIENKIPLDEIIIWDKRKYHEDAEVGDAHKTAQRLIKEHNLKTKLNAFELPWNYHLNIYKTFGKDWIFLPGCQLSFNQTNRIVKTTILDGFAEIKKKNNKIKVGYVEAHDKPRVDLYQGKWYQFYVDIAMITYVGKGGCEMFYFSPEVPELHVKQTHMSIKYFENLLKTYPGANENLVHQVQSFNDPTLYADWNRHIGRICNQNLSAQHGFMKKSDILKNPRIGTLLKLLNYTKKWQKDVYDIYAGGLDQIREISHGKIDMFSGDMPGIMSKKYFVKDFH